MAVSDVSNPNVDCDKSTKELIKSKEKKEKEKALTKVVVRRLPPSVDLESFLMQVAPIPDYDYIYIVNGDLSLGENAFARVYVNFAQPSDVFTFKEKFDNYVFVDQKGHEYPAVVEFASFQKIPRKRKPKLDPKVASIESDPIYLEFLESLKEQPNQDIKPEFSYQFNDTKDDVPSTPLLDYIKQRRIDKQRIREERREERRRKELERKKMRDEERKRHEHKSPGKVALKSSTTSRTSKTSLDSVKEELGDKSEIKIKDEEGSYSEKNVSAPAPKDDQKPYFKPKPRFPTRSEKFDYYDKRPEYKSRRDDYREKEFRGRRFEEYKTEQDVKQMPRRTKKYSEKREERKNEAKRAEQKVVEENTEKSLVSASVIQETNKPDIEQPTETSPSDLIDNLVSQHTDKNFEHQSSVEMDEDTSKEDKECRSKHKDYDPRLQRRIRNKDRPTMAIYQPGMLSKRRTGDEPECPATKE